MVCDPVHVDSRFGRVAFFVLPFPFRNSGRTGRRRPVAHGICDSEGPASPTTGVEFGFELGKSFETSGIYSEPVLLPVWILAYRYKGDLYRFLANGQTGRHTGTAPVSWARIVALGAAFFAAAFVLLLLISLLFAVA